MNYLNGCAKRALAISSLFIFVGTIIGAFIGSMVFLDLFINNIEVSFAICFFFWAIALYIFIPSDEEGTMKSKLGEDGITRY